MSSTTIQTDDFELVLPTLEVARARVDAMTPSQKAELSADWLAPAESATEADPWVHGFEMVHRTKGVVVGSCGFKGPPRVDGVVEIAYGVEPEHQGKGYARQAAQALVAYAFGKKNVRLVRAHTLPETNASTRVLTKCGFRRVGEIVDPDDGPVWRWEKHDDSVASDRSSTQA